MERIFLLCVAILGVFSFCHPHDKDTVFVSDFGAKPYTYINCVKQIQAAIQACKETDAKVLSFDKGRYDIWPEGATRKTYFISNTSSEKECPSKVKTVGLLFEGLEGLEVQGNGALLMFHGEMTTIAIDHCQNVTLNDLHTDFERPAGSELRYVGMKNDSVDVEFHRDSRYEIADGRIQIYGEGWKSEKVHCIEYDPSCETFRYSKAWRVLEASAAQEIAPGRVRFAVPPGFSARSGNVLTLRDIIRDQVGLFIHQSKQICLNQVYMHYMHGLGIVSQYSENITMKKVQCLPREVTGRVLAASADMMHFSGCKGKITIDSCRFSGAHDDFINIHGTNLCAVEQIDARTLNLRFMHGQSYGFQAYFPGDTVAFVRAATMQRKALNCVRSVHRLSDRVWQVAFEYDVPMWLELNRDCVENLTCTPAVEITNNYFMRTSTRGTLVTTPRKVVISGNTYFKTGMCAILIEGDAMGWYESGPVCDVLIEKNIFVDCAYNGGPGKAVIALNPSNTKIDCRRPVHTHIRIVNNRFKTYGNRVLFAKSTGDLSFIKNRIESTSSKIFLKDTVELFSLNGCNDVVIKGNRWSGFSRVSVRISNMKKSCLTKSTELVFKEF